MKENKSDYYYFYCARYNNANNDWEIHDGKARFDDKTTMAERKEVFNNLIVDTDENIIISCGISIEVAFAKLVDYFNKRQNKYNIGLDHLVSVYNKRYIEKG